VRRVVPAVAVCAGALALAPHALAAGTSVSVSGTTATITVNVDVVIGGHDFPASDIDDKTRAYFENMAAQAEAYWNQGLAGRKYKGCTELRLDLQLRVVAGADAHYGQKTGDYVGLETTEGHHVMAWMETEWGGAAARPVVFDPFEPGRPATDDFASPFTHDLDGEWSPDMVTPRDFAHEVGHFMGLGDDYGDHGSLAGRSGTLMDSGDAIDQNLVDRLGKIIEKAGIKLPSCWTGTIESDTTRVYLEGVYGGHTHCTDRWRGTLQFGIASDGKVEGNGEARLTSRPTCDTGTVKLATRETFVVRGSATEGALTLQLAFESGNGVSAAGWVANVARRGITPGGPPLRVPRSDPCTATGTVTVHDAVRSGGKLDPLTAVDRIALKCPQPGST
jgi:hypothetical protein